MAPPEPTVSWTSVAPEAAPGIRILPVVHDRLELAVVVRAALDALDPAGVAVELPTTLATAAEQAVRRLPQCSLVVSVESDEEALVWVVAPGDPFAEALRWALERDRRRLYVDPDIPYLERHPDPVPDPFAVWNLGAETYLTLLTEGVSRVDAPAAPADLQREAGMAFHLRQAAAEGDGDVLALLGAAHVRRVAEAVSRPQANPLARQRRTAVEVVNLHPESLTGLLPDAPLAHAAWELLRDGELPAEVPLESAVTRRMSLLHHGLRLIGRETGGTVTERRHRLAAYAARAAARRAPGGLLGPDRQALGTVVREVAERSYQEQTREDVAPWQRRLFADFARRHARVQGVWAPGLYEWVVAARGVADDNFAWEVFEAARTYPWQREEAEIGTARVDGDELDLGTRRMRFRRRFFRVKQRPVQVPVRRRELPDDPAEWLEGFTGAGICSYPPEDLVVEDYGRFLRQKAVSALAAERRRSEPFTTSLLDGIDMRETLRRLHEGRVWVEELGRAPGRAGSVVVVFDRDLAGGGYPYLMTWLGEHQQESDMAFYSTNPGEQVVGPGILRATYGGFLMTVPPGRLFDVWRDPDYREAREKAEVLLMAAVDYSQEKLVVHVGRTPPGERMQRYAAAQGKKLLHLPIGSLSQGTLKKVRTVHILAGHDKRPIAKDYVW
jgi:hypothetical protein